MKKGIAFTKETIKIEGNRNLYNYTFREPTDLDELFEIIERNELEMIKAFIDSHPDVDRAAATAFALERGNELAAAEIDLNRP